MSVKWNTKIDFFILVGFYYNCVHFKQEYLNINLFILLLYYENNRIVQTYLFTTINYISYKR